MAQYDGSVIIGTEIKIDEAKKQISELEASLEGLSKEASDAKKKLDEMNKTGVSKNAAEYKEQSAKILEMSGALGELTKKREELLHAMEINWDRKNGDISDDEKYQEAFRLWEEAKQRTESYRSDIHQYFESISESARNSAKQQIQEAMDAADTYNLLRTNVEEYAGTLKELQEQGKYFGDEDYDRVYLAWKNANDAVKAYRNELNQQSAVVREVLKEQEAEENRLSEIKNNATVSDQKMVDLLERRKVLAGQLKELEKAGVGVGYEKYDQAYIAWKNATEALKEYQSQLNRQTEAGQAKEAEKARIEAEKQAEAQRKIEEQAERNLQKENARVQKEIENQARLQKKEAEKAAAIQIQMQEEERLRLIKESASVTDQQIIELLERRKQITQEIADLEKAGVGYGYQEYESLKAELDGIDQKVKDYKASLGDAAGEYDNFAAKTKSAFSKILPVLSKIEKTGSRVFIALKNSASKAFSTVSSKGNKSAGILKTFSSRLKGLSLSLLVFNWISKGFNAMISGMKTGIENFTKYSDEYANSVQSLKNAMSTLGNQFAAAFAPIIQAVIPWLVSLINTLSTAISYVSQFIAVLSGKSTFTRAKQIQDDYNGALDETASSAKKAYSALAKFDELNVLQQQEDNAGGSATDTNPKDMFEEVPVDSWIKDFADKFKNILSKFFSPLKKAWNREGKYVMDSWKYALDEVWKLIKDIGRDFLIVWNQEATIQMFADILHIIGDIGRVVGNLARNFREAWNENNTGLHILENIRDIFATIIRNIRKAADYTVEWSEELNFSPLLEAFQRFTESLVPVADNLSGILTDFYTNVLLPLGQWTLEKGLPELLDIFTRFNDDVDWEKLRSDLDDFWKKLEPFAETVGEGLLIFIERLSDLVADFLNSESLENFLDHLAKWMDSIEPEDVADGIEKLAISFIGLRVAVFGVNAIFSSTDIIRKIRDIGAAATESKKPVEQFVTAIDGEEVSIGALGSSTAVTADLFRNFQHLLGDPDGTKTYNSEIKKLNKELEQGKITQSEYEKAVEEAQNKFADKFAESHKMAREELEQTSAEIKKFDEDLSSQMIEDGTGAGIAISTGLEEGISTGIGSNLSGMINPFSLIINGVKALFGIHSPSTVFYEIGYNMVLGLTSGLRETWHSVEDFFADGVESLKVVFENFLNGFLNTTFMSSWKSAWEKAGKLFSALWDILDHSCQAIAELFKGLVKAVKLLIDGDWTGAWDIAKEVFENFKKNISGIIDDLRELVGGFFTWIDETIGKILDGISELGNKLKGSFSSASSNPLFSGSASTMSTENLISPASLEVPALATGAVIPGGRPFLAALGDQPRGQTNVEAPLETIKQALREVMNENGGGEYTFVAQLNGKTLFKETVKQNKMFKKSTGKSAYV